ncbi:hypothetical protein U5801_15275 [Lamprobacter modestohalophilus]|nr:hypothetical protein [Lamprobacter modestohalophilus]MEA1051154.1 hypothetical protein [Lamprobacter modestohalophilus]
MEVLLAQESSALGLTKVGYILMYRGDKGFSVLNHSAGADSDVAYGAILMAMLSVENGRALARDRINQSDLFRNRLHGFDIVDAHASKFSLGVSKLVMRRWIELDKLPGLSVDQKHAVGCLVDQR